MFSPRFSSSDKYSTPVEVSTSTSSFKRHSSDDFTANEELSYSAKLLASAKVQEFLIELPMRSWLGHHITKRVTEEEGLDKESYKLANRIWRSLIRLDDCQKDIKLSILFKKFDTPDLKQYDEVLDRCWMKCRLLLETSAGIILSMNPAYSRSPYFSLTNFIGLVISHSFLDTHLRYKWVRITNLIHFTVAKAFPLLEVLNKKRKMSE